MRVMLTGFAETGANIDAINRGAVHRFFTKPWQDEVLRDSLRDIFRQYWQQHGGERGADGAALVTESLAG
jgi:FixJ family two-component response regulator